MEEKPLADHFSKVFFYIFFGFSKGIRQLLNLAELPLSKLFHISTEAAALPQKGGSFVSHESASRHKRSQNAGRYHGCLQIPRKHDRKRDSQSYHQNTQKCVPADGQRHAGSCQSARIFKALPKKIFSFLLPCLLVTRLKAGRAHRGTAVFIRSLPAGRRSFSFYGTAVDRTVRGLLCSAMGIRSSVCPVGISFRSFPGFIIGFIYGVLNTFPHIFHGFAHGPGKILAQFSKIPGFQRFPHHILDLIADL